MKNLPSIYIPDSKLSIVILRYYLTIEIVTNQEKVLILTLFWNTTSPADVTPS